MVGNNATEFLIWSKKGYVETYFSEESIKLMDESGEQFLNHGFTRQTIEGTHEAVRNFWREFKKVRTDFKKNLSDKELLKLFKRFCIPYRKVMANFVYSREEVMAPAEQRLAKLVKEKFGSSYKEQLITLTTPTMLDLLYREKKDFLALLKNPTEEGMKEHMLKYPLMLFNIESEELAMKTMRTRLAAQTVEEVEQELTETENEKEALKKKQQAILKEAGSKEMEELSWFIQQASNGRLELKSCWGGTGYYLLPLFEEIARRAKASIRNLLMLYTPPDIERLLTEGQALTVEELETRNKAYLLQYKDGKIIVLDGGEAECFHKERIVPSLPSKDTVEIKGMTACLGKVKGKVMKVKVESLDEIQKIAASIKPGTILVTGMTNPNMMVLVKKVVGIVTDEGGMACHAAIVSRELGIPCVVSCRCAMQVLEDGDLVEVDADNAVVRKIE
ncbi:hypothetical protein GOV07_02025 [Candidatus Woesearchaeota archaeon]|nr:hypothetical protein [Candidatus Woesearchaeota archaeon]